VGECWLFNRLYDGAIRHCNDCGWAGDGWELKRGKCPKCKSKDVEEIET
jgi:predicted Zn-ribbon and HTH transcriptional regulator